MDRLSPLDASFLHLEDDVSHLHIGSTAIFGGPPPAYGDLCAMIAGKLPLVPRYRQRVRYVPLGIGRPVLVDDPHFNLGYHVRHTALPQPGGSEQLRNLVGRIMSQKLDQTKPLWEAWMVEGLEDDRWALVSKVHHCLVDGIAGTDLLAVILDPSPEPSAPVEDTWRPGPNPSRPRLAVDSVADLLSSPYEQWRALRAAVRRPGRIAMQAGAVAKGLVTMAGIARPVGDLTLAGPIGPHRRYVWTEVALDDIRTVRRALGGTVNDVVLALVTGGFRDLMAAHGDDTSTRRLRSLVPVSVRMPDERGLYDNRVSAMFAELPVDITDPVERLEVVTAQMERLKSSGEAVAAETLVSLSGFAPPLLFALGARAAHRALRGGGVGIDTVTTNVPGPQQPLYALGRRLERACPFVPIAAPVRVGVAIFSYVGTLTFGVTADYDSIPDPEVLTNGIGTAMTELLKAAEEVGP
jgi:diacylglycerol O-acyltransferase / wax synthase